MIEVAEVKCIADVVKDNQSFRKGKTYKCYIDSGGFIIKHSGNLSVYFEKPVEPKFYIGSLYYFNEYFEAIKWGNVPDRHALFAFLHTP